jgi:membrane dipeptidase
MLVDALQCGHFDRSVFERLKSGGVSCVTPTLGFWEDTLESLDSLGRWSDLMRDNQDLVLWVKSAADFDLARQSRRIAVVFGYQNTNLFGGRIRLVEIFAELGVRVVQLTYNNQNEVGGSCYEAEDSGLSRFGREVVREMNRSGILIDLSHVGDRTTLDAILHSEKPVAITHANPASIIAHKRNKSDQILHALRDNGGVIGCASYRNITGDYFCSSLEKWMELIARTVDLIGIDHVGIGTDFVHKATKADYEWMRSGRWTRGVDYGAGSATNAGVALPPDWSQDVDEFRKIPDGLLAAGFNREEADKILSSNWLRVYSQTFRS